MKLKEIELYSRLRYAVLGEGNYKALKDAVVDKKPEEVKSVYGEVVRYIEKSNGYDGYLVWLECLCLLYLSYVEETNQYYSKCIDKVDDFFAKVDEQNVSRLMKNRIICTRIKCMTELFHFGQYFKLKLSRDRARIFDDIIYYMHNPHASINMHEEVLNMVYAFSDSLVVDCLNNAEDNTVYGFYIGQEVFLNKVLLNLNDNNKFKVSVEVALQSLSSLYSWLDKRNQSDYHCFDEESNYYQERYESIEKEEKEISLDSVTLGLRLFGVEAERKYLALDL